MPKWTCPICDRSFARTGQGHTCEPTAPLEQYLAGWPDGDAEIAWRVIDVVESCGPVDVEAAQVGLFFKTSRSIVQLRPKKNRLELMVIVARPVDGSRVRRRVAVGPNHAIFTDLRAPDDVDDWVHELIFEAYDLRPGEE